MAIDLPTERFAAVPAATPRTHPLRRAGRWVGALLLVAVVGAALAVAGVPAVAGARALTVLSGSMEPALPVGSVVVVRPRPAAEIAVGDVITYTDREPETGAARTVTHRVVGVEPGPVFRTMGDANDAPDPGLVAAADVQGVQWYVVPFVGFVRDLLFSTAGLFLAIGAGLLLLAAHLLVPQASRRRRHRR
jgi:signal peptidase I